MAFIDPNDFEAVALDTALGFLVAFASQHHVMMTKTINGRDRQEKSFLHNLPFTEWPEEKVKELVEAVCSGYVSSLQDQADMANKALQKVTILPPVGAERFPSLNTNSDLS